MVSLASGSKLGYEPLMSRSRLPKRWLAVLNLTSKMLVSNLKQKLHIPTCGHHTCCVGHPMLCGAPHAVWGTTHAVWGTPCHPCTSPALCGAPHATPACTHATPATPARTHATPATPARTHATPHAHAVWGTPCHPCTSPALSPTHMYSSVPARVLARSSLRSTANLQIKAYHSTCVYNNTRLCTQWRARTSKLTTTTGAKSMSA